MLGNLNEGTYSVGVRSVTARGRTGTLPTTVTPADPPCRESCFRSGRHETRTSSF
jgi:hypothetical protein